jgi:hypothetical protein
MQIHGGSRPSGWDEWSPNRRTLWSRQRQLERLLALEDTDDAEKESARATIAEHWRGEIEALQRAVNTEGDPAA